MFTRCAGSWTLQACCVSITADAIGGASLHLSIYAHLLCPHALRGYVTLHHAGQRPATACAQARVARSRSSMHVTPRHDRGQTPAWWMRLQSPSNGGRPVGAGPAAGQTPGSRRRQRQTSSPAHGSQGSPRPLLLGGCAGLLAGCCWGPCRQMMPPVVLTWTSSGQRRRLSPSQPKKRQAAAQRSRDAHTPVRHFCVTCIRNGDAYHRCCFLPVTAPTLAFKSLSAAASAFFLASCNNMMAMMAKPNNNRTTCQRLRVYVRRCTVRTCSKHTQFNSRIPNPTRRNPWDLTWGPSAAWPSLYNMHVGNVREQLLGQPPRDTNCMHIECVWRCRTSVLAGHLWCLLLEFCRRTGCYAMRTRRDPDHLCVLEQVREQNGLVQLT